MTDKALMEPKTRTPMARERMGLFLGPLSTVLTASVWFLGRGWFDYGSGMPSAGRTEGWNLIWLGLLIMVLGHAVSAVWVAARLLARSRSRGPWSRILVGSAAYHLVVIPLALWVWLR